jgi:hypothetical protein
MTRERAQSDLTRPLSNMDLDAFFREDARRLGMSIADYEREYGVHLSGGPAENRVRYHEVTAGLMGQADLEGVAHNEREYTPERNRKRRRGYDPNGASIAPSDPSA